MRTIFLSLGELRPGIRDVPAFPAHVGTARLRVSSGLTADGSPALLAGTNSESAQCG